MTMTMFFGQEKETDVLQQILVGGSTREGLKRRVGLTECETRDCHSGENVGRCLQGLRLYVTEFMSRIHSGAYQIFRERVVTSTR
jgi:hypothetical protein